MRLSNASILGSRAIFVLAISTFCTPSFALLTFEHFTKIIAIEEEFARKIEMGILPTTSKYTPREAYDLLVKAALEHLAPLGSAKFLQAMSDNTFVAVQELCRSDLRKWHTRYCTFARNITVVVPHITLKNTSVEYVARIHEFAHAIQDELAREAVGDEVQELTDEKKIRYESYFRFIMETGAMSLEAAYMSIVDKVSIQNDLQLLRAAGWMNSDEERHLINASLSITEYVAAEWAAGVYPPQKFNSSAAVDWAEMNCESELAMVLKKVHSNQKNQKRF